MSLDKTNTTLQKVYTIDFSFKNKSCLSTNELQSVKKYSKEAEKKSAFGTPWIYIRTYSAVTDLLVKLPLQMA
jgi:hypothetical protein